MQIIKTEVLGSSLEIKLNAEIIMQMHFYAIKFCYVQKKKKKAKGFGDYYVRPNVVLGLRCYLRLLEVFGIAE